MARGDGTAHPVLWRVFMAQQINIQHGGAVIGAWEIEQLPDEWLDAFQGLADLPRRKKRQNAIHNLHQQFRNDYRRKHYGD